MGIESTAGNNIILKLTDEKDLSIGADKMRNALISIASEMQRFTEDAVPLTASDQNTDKKIFVELMKCKSKIKSKRARIVKLRRNLKTACLVAKTMATAKEEESGTLKKRLARARSECDDLQEKYKNNVDIINNLTRENEKLHHKIDNVANFIDLGYKELQRIRCEPSEETSVLFQLRKLILCCGEYYAAYCNEHQKYLQIKQRNRFLENKVIIVENQVEAISEQLRTLQYCKDRLQKENVFMRDRHCSSRLFKMEHVAYSTEIKMKTTFSEETPDESVQKHFSRESDYGDSTLKDSHENVDLSSHLLLVRKLLKDQDTLLKDLKIISGEF